jgi:FkbM family methyltransferase
MFTQARQIIRRTSGLSRLKLLMATASFSRPWLAGPCSLFLRLLSRDGKLSIQYRTNGLPRRIFLRLAHLQSDLCSALELAVGDCYSLSGLKEPAFIVDGGGNTGLFTLAALARWPRAHVVICEPVPDNLAILKEHLAINGAQAELLPVCLGGAEGRAQFYCREANQGSFDADLPYRSVIEVRVQTLSEICRGHEDEEILVKLDIEGAEIEVLEEFLSQPRPRTTIIGELHRHQSQKSTVCEILKHSGWRARFLHEDGETSQFQLFSTDMAGQPAGLTSIPGL